MKTIRLLILLAILLPSCKKVEPTPAPAPTPTPTPAKVAVTGVSISSTSLTLVEGESAALTATVSPNNATDKSVGWKSSDTAVASVDGNGNVKAAKTGSTTITVTTNDGSKIATCSVTVTPKTIEVSEISLDKSAILMFVGDTAELPATIKPYDATDRTITWSSSDTDVATVGSYGTVTAIAAGKATITAYTSNPALTASCEVTVLESNGSHEGTSEENWN